MWVRICKLHDFALSCQSLVRRYFIESVKHKNCRIIEKPVDVHGACVACGCLRQFRNKEVT